MTVDRLYRVIWRLQEVKTTEPGLYTNHQLDVAIIEECGYCDRTLRDTKRQMRKVGLLASAGLGLWRANIEKSNDFRAEAGFGNQTELGTSERVLTAYVPPDSSANVQDIDANSESEMLIKKSDGFQTFLTKEIYDD